MWCCTTYCHSQEVWNDRHDFGYNVSVFTGLDVVGSNIYTVGMVRDTVFPFNLGLFTAHFSQDGEVVDYSPYFLENTNLYSWFGGLKAYGNGYISSGQVEKDSFIAAILVFHDSIGRIDSILEVDSYFGPVEGSVIQNIEPEVGNGEYLMFFMGERNPEYEISHTETIGQLYTSVGDRVWQKNYGEVHGTFRDGPHAVSPYGDGFAVASYLSNSNTVRKDFIARHYLFVIDTLGSKLWQYRTPQSMLLSLPKAMYAEEDGSLIVASFLGEETYVNASTNKLMFNSAYIYKFSPPSNIQWSLQLHTPHQAPAHAHLLNKIIKANDGTGYLLAGSFARYSEEENADIRGWLVKISPEGDSLWERQLRFLAPTPFRDHHYIYDMEATADGGYVMAGEVRYQGEEPPYQRAWLLKVDEYGCLVPGCHLVSTEEEAATPKLALQLFPNPATDFINILLRDAHIARRGQAELRLLSGSGQLLRRHPAGKVDGVTNMMPLDGLPAGPYVLQYVADGQLLSAKTFIKQ
jgi:hypothetical protein